MKQTTATKRNKAKAAAGPRLSKRGKGGTSFAARLWHQRELWIMLIPGILFYAIFRYGPIYGLTIAFKDYNPFLGTSGSPWVGFKHIQRLFSQRDFWELFRNTLITGVGSMAIMFPTCIIFALILNEIRQAGLKKAYQTISYLPSFMSIVIVCSIFLELFSVNSGIINKIIYALGGERINFIMKPFWYYVIYYVSNIWAGMGSGAIIYLAALSGVDQSLYEAAELDGCSRLKTIWHITLPSIRPTIVTLFLLNIGNVCRVPADKALLLQQHATLEWTDIFGTYVYQAGVLERAYSYSAAVGLFESVLAALILLCSNWACRKFTGESLW